MRKSLMLGVAVVVLAGLAAPQAEPQGKGAGKQANAGRNIVGYFVEWGVYQRNYHVANVPADKLTHLNYAFAKINEQGECALFDAYAAIDKAYPGDTWDQGVLRGNFQQLKKLKAKH